MPEPHTTPAVLVVDDEPAVLSLLCAHLASHGLFALPADGAAEALAMTRARRPPFALALLDVDMPGTDGPALVPLLLAELPGLRFCFMTGGARGEAELLALGAERVLGKPFGRGEPAGALLALLGAEQAPDRPAPPAG